MNKYDGFSFAFFSVGQVDTVHFDFLHIYFVHSTV